MRRNTIFVLIMIVVMSVMLISCNDTISPESNPEIMITEGTIELLDTAFLKVNSTISIDGEIIDTVDGIIDRNFNQAKITINDSTYYYFGKIRFVGNDDGISIVDYMSFPSLVDLMGATLLNFTFEKGNFSSIKKKNGIVIAQFVGKGATYSFNTSIDLNGGTLSVFFDDGKITKTVFSSTYFEGQTPRVYTAITSYSSAAKLWEKTPKVIPSPTTQYANFLLKQLAIANPSSTFKSSPNNNTNFKVSGIIDTENLMSSVFVTHNEGLQTITITYKNAQTFIGLIGNVNTVDLCYDENYNVLYMHINKNNKYLLD
ncbi:MAG TPA: hypothetical protein VJ903_04420 [Clostridia bacterium]|nr:hypothetical protein [Clostridia bacterium]